MIVVHYMTYTLLQVFCRNAQKGAVNTKVSVV